MTEKERIKRIVSNIPYPVMVVGSAVMAMHDMDRKLGDLDLFMATQHWFGMDGSWALVYPDADDLDHRFDPPYLERYIDGLKVNIFFTWRVREDDSDLNTNRLYQESEEIDGVCCSPISSLVKWKRSALREKDRSDIVTILDHYPELDKQ